MHLESRKLTFLNRAGLELAGRLDLPATQPAAFALFAHCFTCSKDLPAASRISRGLAERGFGVLRFDFTGLGGSGGEFANTNFSSNVEDLVCAADHLREHYQAPALLVGHSLGGAAVLVAARRLPEVRAVATIGAPSDPAHVRSLLSGGITEILEDGEADVQIAGRRFRIQRQFLDDLERQNLGDELGALRTALLVMHSPADEIVGISHAEKIYRAARGFKSFLSLADADHLLTRQRDAEYAALVLGAWASRYLEDPAADVLPPRQVSEGSVLVEEAERPYTQRVIAGQHVLTADEPAPLGKDRGPSPYDYLLAGLGACTSMTLRMYADRKKWPLEHVRVQLRHGRIHATDCEQCESHEGRVDEIERIITLTGENLDDAQRQRLLEIADKCPVHRTLMNEKVIPTRLHVEADSGAD